MQAVEGMRDALVAVGVRGPMRARVLGGGHVHRTWLVRAEGRGYVAQRLNGHVFPDLAACDQNLRRIDDHLAGSTVVRVPRLLRGADGRVHVTDRLGQHWRISEYAEATTGSSVVRDAGSALLAARAFGRYVAALADLPGPPLHATIVGFHDLAWRLDQLDVAVEANQVRRLASCGAVVDLVRQLAADTADISGLPIRAVHNDAKVGNLRWPRRKADPIVVLDLDTTMPGSIVFDTSELLRTASHDAAEDTDDLALIRVDPEQVAAIVRGFCEGADPVLSVREIEAIVPTASRLATENAARMLTDHLQGDVYYRVDFASHNLLRARAQAEVARQLLRLAGG